MRFSEQSSTSIHCFDVSPSPPGFHSSSQLIPPILLCVRPPRICPSNFPHFFILIADLNQFTHFLLPKKEHKMRSSSSLLILLSILTIATLARGAEKQQNKKDDERNGIEDELGEEIDEAKPNGDDEQQTDLSHGIFGFGTDIDWVGWPDAISLALDLNRPIFLLIHKTWCGACSALKKSFNTSNKRAELVELSKQFVMVNLEDDDEPDEEIYSPDGRYIPRLFILDKNGEPMAVDNAKNYPNNRQYFPQVPDVIKAMKKGLDIFEGGERKKEETKGPKEPKKEGKKKREEVEMKKDDLKASGCPHAAGKAAKKAAEEAAKKEEEKMQTKGKGEKNIKESDQKQEKNEKEEGMKKKEGEKEKQKNEKKKKEGKTKEEL